MNVLLVGVVCIVVIDEHDDGKIDAPPVVVEPAATTSSKHDPSMVGSSRIRNTNMLGCEIGGDADNNRRRSDAAMTKHKNNNSTAQQRSQPTTVNQ